MITNDWKLDLFHFNDALLVVKEQVDAVTNGQTVEHISGYALLFLGLKAACVVVVALEVANRRYDEHVVKFALLACLGLEATVGLSYIRIPLIVAVNNEFAHFRATFLRIFPVIIKKQPTNRVLVDCLNLI